MQAFRRGRRRISGALFVLAAATGLPLVSAPQPAAAGPPYTVTLTAERSTAAIGESVRIVANANQTMWNTPYGITIYDQATGEQIEYCGVTPDCWTYVAKSVPGTHSYVAFVSTWEDTYPPQNIQATSNPVSVTWTLPSEVDAGTYGYGAPTTGTISWGGGGLGYPYPCSTAPGIFVGTAPSVVVDGSIAAYVGPAEITITFSPYGCETLTNPTVSYGALEIRAGGTNPTTGSTMSCQFWGQYSREITYFGGNGSGRCTLNGYTTSVHGGGVSLQFVTDPTVWPTPSAPAFGHVSI